MKNVCCESFLCGDKIKQTKHHKIKQQNYIYFLNEYIDLSQAMALKNESRKRLVNGAPMNFEIFKLNQHNFWN